MQGVPAWAGSSTGVRCYHHPSCERAAGGSARLGQEGVEAEDEVAVAAEQSLDLADYALRVDRLRLELFHDLEKCVIHLTVVLEFLLDISQV